MDASCGELPFDPALEAEFRLWCAALAEHGQPLPDGGPPADETPVQVGPTTVPATLRPETGLIPARRRRWPAAVFVAALVLTVAAAGYQELRSRQPVVSHAAPAPTPAASIPPPPDRAMPADDDAARRAAEQADNVAHAGEALAASGDLTGALRFYRQSLSIRRELSTRDPGNAAKQRALAVSWIKVGDTLAIQGDTTRSLGAYRDAEAAWERCARALPADRDVLREWSLTALSTGNLLLARNEPTEAAEAFRRGASIQETLCRQEPDNAAWQEDLALAWLRLGDALDQRGDDEAALQASRRALAADEALVTRDPANPTWQGDLATAHGKVGDLLLARNEADAALQEYAAAASLWQKLAAAGGNPARLRAAAEMQDRIGQTLEIKKQPVAALPLYQEALGTARNLASENPADPSIEGLRAAVSYHLGRASAHCQPPDRQAARTALRNARDLLTALKSAEGESFSRDQAEMLNDTEKLLDELDR